MESSNRSSNFSNAAYTNGQIPASSFPFLSDSSSKGKQKIEEEGVSHHQRCLSESLDEEPFWLEDLLSEPVAIVHKGHRRSASDSFAYLGAAADRLNVNVGPVLKDVNRFSSDATSISSDEMVHKACGGGLVLPNEKHNKEESSSQNTENSSEKANNPQPKPSMSGAEAKRAKQQSAHRSRVRKLQQIAGLESTVQALQVEESMVSAELEFLDQQNLILSMENRALRQRLDSLSQEFLIKHMEQEMLERELGRLQTLYQLQRHHHHHQPPPQQNHHHSNHRRTRSRDLLEGQFANLSLKNNEVSSSRTAPVTHPVWIQ